MNGILAWQNENGLSYYPLERNLVVRDFIVDASFVQFDGFVPILKSIAIKTNKIILGIQFDRSEQLVEVLDTHVFGTGVRIRDGSRYLGTLTIGPGYDTLKLQYMSKALTVNVSFMPLVVNSISSQAGVYMIEGVAGAIPFTADDTIHYNVSGNNVIWSAVALANGPQDLLALKSLNQVLPEANNITIYDSDLMKIIPGLGTVTFQLASSDVNANPSS